MSASITKAISAMINIVFSYFVTDSLLHSREIGGKPPQMQASPCDCILHKICVRCKTIMSESEVVVELFKMYGKLAGKDA